MSKFEYTAEITADVVKRYKEVVGEAYEVRAERVREIASDIGASEASVRAKLTSEKVYKAKEDGAEVSTIKAKKAEIVKALGVVIGKDVESFENASKADLEALWNFLIAESNRKELGE
jgi:hypothetical protein